MSDFLPISFFYLLRLLHSELPLNFLAIPLGSVDWRGKGGKWAKGDERDEGASLGVTFPQSVTCYVCTTDFERGIFVDPPSRTKTATTCATRAPCTHARRTAVILPTTSVGCAGWVGLIAGAASLYGVSTLEWKLVAAVCTCCRERLRTVVKAWSMIIMPRILSFIAI